MIFTTVVWSVVLLFVVILFWRVRGRKGPNGRRYRSGPGPGAMGAVHDMLNEEKRRAIEIVVEGRAEATDPEHAAGTPKAGGNGRLRPGG